MNISQINAAFPEIFSVFFFLAGACIGSFLNVCIYRIPAGKSIINPPSHCACGAPIKFYQNIPILTWFFLRGKAACCGRRISFRYPLVETLTAFVFLGMWLLLPLDKALVGMAFASLMIFCSFVDIDTMTLPDAATVGGAVAGVLISIALPNIQNIPDGRLPFFGMMMASGLSSVIGAAVGAGVVYWLRLLGEIVFRREAMGEGDVILIGCIGAFCGWQGALFAIFGGSVMGAVIMLPVVLISSLFAKDGKSAAENSSSKNSDAGLRNSSDALTVDILKNSETSNTAENFSGDAALENDPTAIPFGPWLALGGVVYYMFLSKFVDDYFAALAKLFF